MSINSLSLFPSLCAVVDVEVAARSGWTVPDLATAYLRGGARFLQIRAKSTPSVELLGWCEAIIKEARERECIVIVNDYADLAKLSGADGVHVGQDDLSPEEVRRIVGTQAVVGLSTHTLSQIGDGARGLASYLAVGPVSATHTKKTGYNAVGLDMVRLAVKTTHKPIVAIGGITLESAPEVLRAGACSVAVISDLLATGDPERRVHEYLETLRCND